jgi:hypothetical protein
MTPFHIRRKLKKTIKGTMLGVTCCTVIYASLLMITAKSFLKVQSSPIDL